MRRLTSPGWLLRHAIVVVLVVAFLGLGWWQLGRAAQGNALSFGYTIEWPFFAAFVIFMWIREMRIALRGGMPPTGRPSPPRLSLHSPAEHAATTTPENPATTPDTRAADDVGTSARSGVTAFDVSAALARRADEQRAGLGVDDTTDYNRYLAWLAAHPDARPCDYPQPGQGPAGAVTEMENTESTHG